MTRSQIEKKVEKLRGQITTRQDKRHQLGQEVDQLRAEVRDLQTQLKTLPKVKAKAGAGREEE